MSSGTRPGTETIVQPVRANSRSFSSSKSGMPGLDRLQHVEAAEEVGDRPALQRLLLAREQRGPRRDAPRGVNRSQFWGIVQSPPPVSMMVSVSMGFLRKEKPRPEVRTGFEF